MTLYKWVRDDIEKYSFITRTEFKKAIFYIYYEHKGKENVKKLPFRVTPRQVQKTIDKIKKEIGYKQAKLKKEHLDKGFCFTN